MKLKFSFHLIWTFFVNISHAAAGQAAETDPDQLSLISGFSSLSPLTAWIAPSESETLQICILRHISTIPS